MPGQGNPIAKIMIVAENPEQADDDAGKPMRGLHGAKLDFLLKHAGLTRDDIWLTYTVKCRPPKGKTIYKRHFTACGVHLKEEIKWVRPKVVITMGGNALKGLAPDLGGLSGCRGFPYPYKNPVDNSVQFYILPTQSTKYAMAMVNSDDILIRDLRLAKAIADGDWEPQAMNVRVTVARTLDEIRALAARLIEEKEWAFDLETTERDFVKDDVLCFSFGFSATEAAVVPFYKEFDRGGETVKWTEEELAEIVNILRPAFAGPARKSAQNGKFDINFLRVMNKVDTLSNLGIRVKGYDFDTMLAHHLLDVNKPHDLLFIAQWYGVAHEQWDAYLESLFRKIGKHDMAAADSHAVFNYAGIDAAVTQALRPILMNELEKNGLMPVFREISMPLNHVLANMEYYGARIDRKRLVELGKLAEDQIGAIMARIKSKVGDPEFKPSSPKQVLNYLIKVRALRPPRPDVDVEDGPKLTKSGNLSVDEEVLSRLEKAGKGKGVPGLIVSLRQWEKMKGTYLDGKDGLGAIVGQLDWRHYAHTNYKIHGTISGRLSSAKPNLQNVPKDAILRDVDGKEVKISVRSCFVPDEEGDEFMSVDYRQLEVRVAAALSKDLVLIKEINDGVDMHSRNAATVLLGITEEEFLKVYKDKKHPLFDKYKMARDAAKAVTFGVLYGSGPQGVADRNDIPLELAEKFIRGFFRKYTKLAEWIKDQHRNVRESGIQRTATGRIVRFPVLKWAYSKYCPSWERNRQVAEVERVAVNLPIQSFGSDIFQKGKIKMFVAMSKAQAKSRFVLSIHDGGILNVKPDEKEAMEALAQQCMRTVLNPGTKYAVPLDIDVTWMPRWGAA